MKIQYQNKVAIDLDPTIPEINKVTDGNMNEIKTVVNANADTLDDVNETVTEFVNGVDNRLGTVETTTTSLETRVDTAEDDIDNLEDDVSDIQDDIDTLETNLSNLTTNTYTKTQVDTLINNTEGLVTAETTNRQNADNNLQSQIDSIVASSDVVDIVGTYQDLQNYDTSKLGDNDIIKVLDDNTHNNATSYYRWKKQISTWQYIGSKGPYYTQAQTDNKFVEKITGKGLSTNDFTNELKSKLDGIEANAEVNIIESVKVNNVTQTITNKSVNIPVPTATSDLTNDSNFVTNTDYATASTGGVIKGNVNGLYIGNTGNPLAGVYTNEAYQNLADNYFIGKGTLENVLTARIGDIDTILDNINR